MRAEPLFGLTFDTEADDVSAIKMSLIRLTRLISRGEVKPHEQQKRQQ
jgi:hypothetical protein